MVVDPAFLRGEPMIELVPLGPALLQPKLVRGVADLGLGRLVQRRGGGCAPAGRGVFVERITLAENGDSFSSKIRYDQYDTAGKPAEGGGEATGRGARLRF